MWKVKGRGEFSLWHENERRGGQREEGRARTRAKGGKEGERTDLQELESESDVVLEVSLGGDPHEMRSRLGCCWWGGKEVGHP